jgi:uncharacterized protein (TIGR00251 family)
MKIKVRVMPNSVREEVAKQGDEYVVRVKVPPQEGKANEAVIKLVAAYLKVPKSTVRITSGLSGRNKIIEITGM